MSPTEPSSLISPVRKAVIPAAGLGTRFLPFSKVVPKEMLPVVDKPVIQYVVEDAVAAGLDDITIVTSRHKKAIEDHFDRFPELEQALAAKGKVRSLDQVRELAEMAKLHFIRQGEMRGLGHAIGMAREHVGDEPFVVLLADTILKQGVAVLRGMIEAYHTHQCSVVAIMEVPPEEISAYGCTAVEPMADPDRSPSLSSLLNITSLVEKPAPEVAPSNWAIAGCYLFTPDIFALIAETEPGAGGEIQVTDAMATLLKTGQIVGYPCGRYDAGNKLDYLRVVMDFALQHEELGPGFRAILGEVAAREGFTS